MPDNRVQHKDLLFNGKLMTGEPASIGQNFRTLKNLRYTDTHVKGVAGMTEINTSKMHATYFKTRSAFHLNKSQPAESHVLAQAFNTGLTVSTILQNTAVIPGTAAFSADILMTCSGTGLGRFSEAPDGQVIFANGVDTCIWGGNEMKLGALVSNTVALNLATDTPTLPKDYTEEVNNTKTADDFTCGGDYKTFLVGSPRPASGATFYFSSVNVTANTLVVKESTTGAWNALVVSTDGTRTGGTKSFAQNGKISWPTTVATTKPKYIEGYYLYWYQFTIDAGTADIYYITLDCPFQGIIDMWDGVYRDIARFYIYTTSQLDNSVNVYRDDFDTASPYTYADISSLAATVQYLEIGFVDKQTAIYFQIPPSYENGDAAVVSIDYWNGAAWATVGSVSDGTVAGAASLTKSGVMSWVNANIASEQRKQYANAIPLYYYRVKWDGALDAAVRLNYVAGIPASKTISYYKFPVFAQGRVFLCCDMSGDKNKAICSARYMPQVYNGIDSVDVYFGEEGELNCGTGLFSQFGSSLYSLILMFKDSETWIMAGQDIEQWGNNTFMISSSIGCPAPATLKTINLSMEPAAGINRALAIWQGANGVYMSDGRAPIPIHWDIKEYFNPLHSLYIGASNIGNSSAEMDHVNQEYHLFLANGTELVYDIARNKWFEMVRIAGQYTETLKCGVSVKDTNGNSYLYGFIDSGYMERLEYGTTFDGADIVHTVQFGDIPLAGTAVETRVSAARLVTVAKTVTSNDITLTHYGNSSTTGTDKTMDPTKAGYRVAMPDWTDKFNGDPFHSFKLVMTTNDEATGFEPMTLTVSFHSVHEDT